jgi:hypothetical protein
MDYQEVTKLLAEKLKAEYDYQRDENAAVIYATPVEVVFFRKSIDGIQWFEIHTHYGRITDFSVLPAVELLAENRERDGVWAIKELKKGPMLIIKDRYALREEMPVDQIAQILWQRSCIPENFYERIPPIKGLNRDL